MREKLLLLLASLLSLFSCVSEKSPGKNDIPGLTVDTEQILVSAEGCEGSFTISSNCYWDVSVTNVEGKAVTWITLDTSSGQETQEIAYTVNPNLKAEEREAVIQVTTPSSSQLATTIPVRQEAGEGSGYD